MSNGSAAIGMNLRPSRLGGVGIGVALAAVIAALIQIQPTVRLFGQETRLAGSDPIVGAVAVAAALALLAGRMPFRIWRGSWVWPGIAAMTLVLAASFAIGYAALGELSRWALQNRIVGWAILLAYMLCGGILRLVYGPRAAEAFLESFVIVGSIIAAFGIGALMLVNLGLSTWIPFDDAQLRGLVANSNAFGLLALLAMTAIWLIPLRYAPSIRGALAAIWAVAAFQSFSRATWIACVVVVAGLLVMGRLPWRAAVLWMAVPVAAAAALISIGTVGKIVAPKIDGVVTVVTVPDPGITGRVRLARAALELWQEAPILGAGLGVHWQREQMTNPEHPLLLHSTPLWLLAETGLVGFGVFGGFAVYAMLLWIRARRAAARDDRLIEEVAIVYVCAFAVMSVFHDMLYQRVLWLVLGLALAAPRAARLPSRSKSG